MREILFRGKNDRGKWVYGSLIVAGEYCCILESEKDVHPMDYPYLDSELGTIDGKATPVMPETISQYTGYTDKNGKKIFDGDIVKTKYGRLCIVEWLSTTSTARWDLSVVGTIDNVLRTEPPSRYDLWWSENLEIVGNIYDNLKGAT